MKTIRYVVVMILAVAMGTVQAEVQQTKDAAQLMDDYHEVGFLSDYSRLKPDEMDDHALIYRDPAVDAAKYNKLLIDRIKIFFEDEAAYKGIDPTELKALTDYFHDAIVKAVSAEPNGYPVVTETGPDVIHLRLAVTNVVPNKPEASMVSLAVPFLWLADAGTGVAKGEAGSTAFVGEASVEMEALDSMSNEQVAAYIQTRIPKKYNYTEGVTKGVTSYANAYSTWAYTKKAMDGWAQFIRQRLDAAHSVAPKAD